VCHRLNQQTLHFAEERGELVTNFTGKPLLNTETGTIRTAAQIENHRSWEGASRKPQEILSHSESSEKVLQDAQLASRNRLRRSPHFQNRSSLFSEMNIQRQPSAAAFTGRK
jgi:hypothetical protein